MDFEVRNLFDETFFHEIENYLKIVVNGIAKEQP